MSHHLTHEQLCDLILASSEPTPENESNATYAAEDHLRNCLLCTAELQNLRTSLSLFRHAAHSYAGQVYAQTSINKASIAPSPRYRSHILYWATAAALTIAAALPFGLHRQHPPVASRPAIAATMASQTTESDEALLEGIAQDLSTDVPSPMQPLADPTDGAATPQSISAQRKN